MWEEGYVSDHVNGPKSILASTRGVKGSAVSGLHHG